MSVVGIDLGGTHVRAALLDDDRLGAVERAPVPRGDADAVLAAIFALVDPLVGSATAIGVGVPSLVDPDAGVVRDVPNIPSWRDVPLARLLGARYGVPAHVDNDANAFIVAEHRRGAARDRGSAVGLVLGTGVGAGVVVDHRLHRGRNGGAGEIGMLPYREHTFERYCSGQLFSQTHGTTGEDAFAAAQAGDLRARAIFDELGAHLGQLVLAIVAVYDPEIIVLGGSVARSHALFAAALTRTLATFPYASSIARLSIVPAALPHAGVVGAALLAGEHA